VSLEKKWAEETGWAEHQPTAHLSDAMRAKPTSNIQGRGCLQGRAKRLVVPASKLSRRPRAAQAYPTTFGDLPYVFKTSITGAATGRLNTFGTDAVYSFHPGGVNALFVDGSVHFLSSSVSSQTFASLVTRSGGETVAEGF